MVAALPIPQLVDEWLSWAEWSAEHRGSDKENPYAVAFDEFYCIVKDDPDRAWEAILAVIAEPRANSCVGILAAGPVEDLLSHHGARFIERVEVAARSNPNFASMLGGVWRSDMPEEIWARIQAVWDRRGWDGIPSNDG